MARSPAPTAPSTADARHAAVITAMRCGFAIGPPKSAGAPSETPRARTYAVPTARTAAAHPRSGPQETDVTAYPAATRTTTSAMRSGTSLKTGPAGVPRPPSMATTPSSRLQSSRSWIDSAARARNAARAAGASGRRSIAIAATAANPRLATEITSGETPARVSLRAVAATQREPRVRSGRRATAGAAREGAGAGECSLT